MSDTKSPTPRIDGQGKDGKADKSTGQPVEEPTYEYPDEPGVFERASDWVRRTFPGHENAFVFGVIGFLIAVFIFAIGFFQTIFVAILVLIGVAIGQQIDGDPKIINALRHLFSNDR